MLMLQLDHDERAFVRRLVLGRDLRQLVPLPTKNCFHFSAYAASVLWGLHHNCASPAVVAHL